MAKEFRQDSKSIGNTGCQDLCPVNDRGLCTDRRYGGHTAHAEQDVTEAIWSHIERNVAARADAGLIRAARKITAGDFRLEGLSILVGTYAERQSGQVLEVRGNRTLCRLCTDTKCASNR